VGFGFKLVNDSQSVMQALLIDIRGGFMRLTVLAMPGPFDAFYKLIVMVTELWV
jgi:hypothetical protein